MARVVFLGTPEYAVPVLEALLAQHQVVAVVTQPERVAGRGRCQVYPPAVKALALAHGVPLILQPERLRRDRQTIAALRQAQADVFVLAAYGQILSPEVLNIAPHGCIGVHASLLPRWRGAAPITRAILHGDQETGITLMHTDAGMDTGAIIAQRHLTIAPNDTTGTLTDKLARLGADLTLETLPAWLAGTLQTQPQDEADVTYAACVSPEEGALDWTHSAHALDCQVRAMTPWPGAYTEFQGTRLKVLRAHPLPDWRGSQPPGTVISTQAGVGVATGAGLLALDIIQLAGKKALDAQQFCRGQRAFAECTLGS